MHTLHACMLAYIHMCIGMSPFELFFGRLPKYNFNPMVSQSINEGSILKDISEDNVPECGDGDSEMISGGAVIGSSVSEEEEMELTFSKEGSIKITSSVSEERLKVS